MPLIGKPKPKPPQRPQPPERPERPKRPTPQPQVKISKRPKPQINRPKNKPSRAPKPRPSLPPEGFFYQAVGCVQGSLGPIDENNRAQLSCGETTFPTSVDPKVGLWLRHQPDPQQPLDWLCYPRQFKREPLTFYVVAANPQNRESGQFTIQGRVTWIDPEKVVVQIRRNSRPSQDKRKNFHWRPFQLTLRNPPEGIRPKQYWTFQARLEGTELIVVEGQLWQPAQQAA